MMKLLAVIFLSVLVFFGISVSAKATKKPASIEKTKDEKVPFSDFYGQYQISSCESSGQMMTEYCDYKYLIVSKVGMIGSDGRPTEAVKFRYMTLQNAGSFLDNSLAWSQVQKDAKYVDDKDSAVYRRSVIDSSGHTLSNEIQFIKTENGTYQLKNKSTDMPKEGDGFVGETILTLKKI